MSRITKLQQSLRKRGLDYFLINDSAHLRYLSGFSGSNGLALVSPGRKLFLTDFRYKNQVRDEVKQFDIRIAERDLWTTVGQLKQLAGRKLRIGFEPKRLSYYAYQRLRDLLPRAELVPAQTAVDELVAQKEPQEIEKIRKAAEIVDHVFSEVVNLIKPGTIEMDIAAELEYQMKMRGAAGSAFEPIVASGTRSALPHGRPTSKKMKKGELVTLDFGANYDGYVSDLTRTVIIGKANSRQKQVYSIVSQAQKKGIDAVHAAKDARAVDKVARDIIAKKGFGSNFGHGLGHGIGVEVHESPTLSPKSTDRLKPNMVVTIEPGIYISGWGGVRIEDDVLVTTNGPEVLTASPKELLEL